MIRCYVLRTSHALEIEWNKVFVEYTISLYSVKKVRPNVEGFEAGTTFAR